MRRAIAVGAGELRFQLARRSSWVLLALVGLLSVGFAHGSVRLASGDTTAGGHQAFVTSELAVSQLAGFSALLYAFFIAAAASAAVRRDQELRPLLGASGLRAWELAVGKGFAVLVPFSLIGAAQMMVLAVSSHGFHDPEVHPWIGPFSLAAYARPYAVFLLPTLVMFTVGALALSARMSRDMGGLALPLAACVLGPFWLWTWAPSWIGGFGDHALSALDPFAVRYLDRAYLAVDRGVHFYNHASLPLTAGLVLHRLGWIALAIVALASSAGGLLFPATSARRLGGRRWPSFDTTGLGLSTLGLSHFEWRSPPLPAGVRLAWQVGKTELRALLRSPVVRVFAPLAAIQTLQQVSGAEGPFGTGLLLVSGQLAAMSSGWLTVVVAAMLVFTTSMSLARDRSTGAAALTHSTPVTTVSLVLGKGAANAILSLLILALSAALGLAAVAVQGTVPLEVAPFLVVYGALVFPTHLAIIALVAAAYALSTSRGIAQGVGLGLIAATAYFFLVGELDWSTNWMLLGALRWSDLAPFEIDREALVWNRVFVLLAAAALLRIATDAYRRVETDVTQRPGPRWRRVYRWAPLAVALVPFGVLFVGVRSGSEARAEAAALEYVRFHHETHRDAVVPAIVTLELELVVHPSERSFEAEGSYLLEHIDAEPLDELPLTLGSHFEDVSLTLNGRPVSVEARAGLVVVPLEPPLAAGDRIRLEFRHRGAIARGFRRGASEQGEFILPSGVVLNSFNATMVPVLGYQPSALGAEELKLEPRRYPRDFHLADNSPDFGASRRSFHARVTLRGPRHFTLLSAGRLVSDEVDGEERVTRFETTHPIRFFNVVGGPGLQVRRGDRVAVYYHPQHAYNVDEILETMEAAKRHYSAWFAPYPWDELRLTEFPGLIRRAQGFPTNIAFSESVGFLSAGELNAAFTITAHEVAHQWWATLLTPARGPGAGAQTEGMSHCATLLLAEEMRGPAFRRQLAKHFERRYLENRRRDAERPLFEVDGSRPGDGALQYERSGWALWMLIDRVGGERAFEGLRRLFRERMNSPDHPALADVTEALVTAALRPDEQRGFVAQWFGDTVLPELRLDDVTVDALEDRLRVRGTIRNLGTGAVEVGLGFSWDDGREPEERAVVRVAPQEPASFELFAPKDAVSLIVDPEVRLLMASREAAQAPLLR